MHVRYGKAKHNNPIQSTHTYTTFRIGGHAQLLVEPQNEEQTVLCLRLIKEYKQPWIVLGRGSNVLFPEPDRPITAANSPFGIWILTRSSATMSPSEFFPEAE